MLTSYVSHTDVAVLVVSLDIGQVSSERNQRGRISASVILLPALKRPKGPTMTAQPKPSAPDTSAIKDADFEAEIQEGIAAADAGRVTSWSAIREWMMSWGSANELPVPGQSTSAPRPR